MGSDDRITLPDFSDMDVSQLAPIYNPLPSSSQNLYPEDWNRKTMGQEIMSNTGVSYVAGVGVGTLYGVTQGISKIRSNHLSSTKLRLNAILNGCSKNGSAFGNRAGILAILYTTYDNLIPMNDVVDLPRSSIPYAAAAATGFTYNLTGLKQVYPPFIGAALGLAAMGLYKAAQSETVRSSLGLQDK